MRTMYLAPALLATIAHAQDAEAAVESVSLGTAKTWEILDIFQRKIEDTL